MLPDRNKPKPQPAAATDPELIEAAIAGNQMAFQVLLERYRSIIKGYLWGKLPPDLDPEDLMQEIFISVYQNLHRLRDRRRFGPWLVTIARNCLNDSLRRRSVRFRAAPDETTAASEALDGRLSPSQASASKEVTNAVIAGLNTLPDRYRIVLSMRLLQEMSVVEIAAMLGITENTARVRLHRGLAKLHAHLDRAGIDRSSIS